MLAQCTVIGGPTNCVVRARRCKLVWFVVGNEGVSGSLTGLKDIAKVVVNIFLVINCER